MRRYLVLLAACQSPTAATSPLEAPDTEDTAPAARRQVPQVVGAYPAVGCEDPAGYQATASHGLPELLHAPDEALLQPEASQVLYVGTLYEVSGQELPVCGVSCSDPWLEGWLSSTPCGPDEGEGVRLTYPARLPAFFCIEVFDLDQVEGERGWCAVEAGDSWHSVRVRWGD